MGKLFLVGAGPGNPELITLKALNVLKRADVVLYDALVNPELLNYCKPDCIKTYVGKKAGLHSYQQILINDMLVDYARQYKVVVRLKGGDPYVFGRGHEELSFAIEHGIETEVVPGISSAVSVPATHRIPLTKRGINESFWVVTGTTVNGALSKDLGYAAKSSATVIILMGMKNLSRIRALFQRHRKDTEPVAVIQNGTWANERKVIGTLACIEQRVLENGLSNPAIIVVGEVVKEGTSKLEWQEKIESAINYG